MIITIHKDTGKKFLIKDTNKDYHTNFGILHAADLDRAKNGDIIKSHLGEEFIVIKKPSFVDLLDFIKRGPQITHWKDIGILVSLTGISSGWKIVEGGTGSGYLTAYLANLVKPNGKIFSYEKRKAFFEIAKKNLEFLGLSKFVELKNKDISLGIEEKNVDMVVLDISEPWKVFDFAYNSLKPLGYLALFVPDVKEMIQVIGHLDNIKFLNMGIYEVVVRKWIKKKGSLRPINKQLVHTEFLMLFRKIQ